jgi:hypothetical protein
MDDVRNLCIGDRLLTKLDHMLDPGGDSRSPTGSDWRDGTGRRRQFASEFKARIIEGRLSRAPSFRRRGLTPQ